MTHATLVATIVFVGADDGSCGIVKSCDKSGRERYSSANRLSRSAAFQGLQRRETTVKRIAARKRNPTSR